MNIDPISIAIKKALITRLSVELKLGDEEKKADFVISGSYLTAQNRVVSDFTFFNSTWVSEDKKVEIPQEIKDRVHEIFDLLTPLIYDKVNNTFKELPEVAKPVETDEVPF